MARGWKLPAVTATEPVGSLSRARQNGWVSSRPTGSAGESVPATSTRFSRLPNGETR